MEYLVKSIEIITSSECLFTTILFSMVAKIYFLSRLLPYGLSIFRLSWFLLVLMLSSSLFGDFAWFIKLGRILYMPSISYATVTFFIRIAWAFLIIQYHSLALFIQSVSCSQFKVGIINKMAIALSSILSGYFFYIAFFNAHVLCDKAERECAQICNNFFEMNVMQITVFYLLSLLIIPGMYVVYTSSRNAQLPKIIRQQLRTFLLFMLIPYLAIEFLLGFCFGAIEKTLYPLISLSTILLIYIVNYCLQQVMRMRFLNATPHVVIKDRINVMEDVKTMLEQLGNASSMHELTHITQTFFKAALHIPSRNTTLMIRSPQTSEGYTGTLATSFERLEQFFHSTQAELLEYVNNTQLLVHDEIAYDHFYNPSHATQASIALCDALRADIVIPIYAKQTLVAYIVIAHNARQESCYSGTEYDAMLMFASYLGNVINILEHNNIERLVHKTKDLHDEVYYRHQEINHYKESLHSVLRTTQTKTIGIIFYKQGTFTYANQAASELIDINLNTQEGHPLTKAFKHVADYVGHYKTQYTYFTKNSQGQTLVLTGMLHAHRENIIIMASYPDISDLVARQTNELTDPNNWDYVLYLETTHAGAHINRLLPGTGPALLSFKIELLKAALSKRALLIDAPDEDVIPVVEHINHISMREPLHTIELTAPTKPFEICSKLFGAGAPETGNVPLLKLIDAQGTLCIKNIHFLDHETQAYLAEYITYGTYRRYNTDQKLHSSVRIICSTHQTMSHLIQGGVLIDALNNALKQHTITMPSLSTLSHAEVSNLIDGFAEQVLHDNPFPTLISLSEKEKAALIASHPVSLQELKTKIHNALQRKVRDNNLLNDIAFDPTYEVSDPELTHAARLGKRALKDEKIMSMLWHKFKNQNKIALFLGVNRSSVHRRFKAYSLGEEGLA